MLNIHLTTRYIAAYDWLLEDNMYDEEVAVEASVEPFHLTCSIGHDRHGFYMIWNLRYYDAFIERKVIRSKAFETSSQAYLLRETQYKFRQLLLKAANRSDSVAQMAREQLAKLEYKSV